MHIGELANASGISAKMIRYYEQIELLPQSYRTVSGYRTYAKDDIHRLRFIRKARDLGFSVAEIRDLLDLWSNRSRKSSDVKRIVEAHIAELQEKIHSLQQMTSTLQSLVDCCAGDKHPKCPILEELEQDDTTAGSPAKPSTPVHLNVRPKQFR